MNRTALRPLLASLAGLALLSGCGTLGAFKKGEPDPAWVVIEIVAPSERVLCEVIASALEKAKLPLGSGFDRVQREILSGWRTSLSPFRGEGFRAQALVRWERLERRRFEISVRVRRQTNDELARPLSLADADWEWAQDDQLLAREILHHVVAHFPPELEVDLDEGGEGELDPLPGGGSG